MVDRVMDQLLNVLAEERQDAARHADGRGEGGRLRSCWRDGDVQ